MKNIYRIEKVDPVLYTEEDWKSYYDFRAKSCALIDKSMPFDSLKKLKEAELESIKWGDEIYQVWKNEQEQGTFAFLFTFKDDLEKRSTLLSNNMNDKHIESNLLEIIFKKYIDYDEKSNSLLVYSIEGVNDYLKDLYGAKNSLILSSYELNVKEANVELIDTWLAEAPAKFPNLRLELYKEIPDDLIEEFATFYTQMYKDLPGKSDLVGDMIITAAATKSFQEDWKLNNSSAYRYLIFNEANQLIAMTDVSLNLKRPQVMDQMMTGVMGKYRGRGLSKWLKAAMFKRLISDFPELEKIETKAHPENHASRELSKKMGFKLTGTEKQFMIDRANIVEYLNAND